MGRNLLKHGIAIAVAVILCSHQMAADKGAPRLYFHNYSINDGLSQNTVNDILQDQTGFLWFATKDGLNRYDGHVFKRYGYSPEPGSLKNNYVNKLFEDKNGKIWVGTDTGLYWYDLRTDRFSPFITPADSGEVISNSVISISGDHSGNIWVGVEQQGLFCIDPEGKTVRFHSFFWDAASMYVEENGRIWVGTYGGGLYYSDDGAHSFSHYPMLENGVVLSLIKGKDHSLLIGTLSHGIWKMDLSSGICSEIISTDTDGNLVQCRELLMGPAGEIYAGTEKGLFLLEGTPWKIHHFKKRVGFLFVDG